MTGQTPSSTGRGENDFPRFHGKRVLRLLRFGLLPSRATRQYLPVLSVSVLWYFITAALGLRLFNTAACIASPQARPGLERAGDSGSWFPVGETRSYREKDLHLIGHTHPKQSDWGGICTSWVLGGHRPNSSQLYSLAGSPLPAMCFLETLGGGF